MEKDNNYTNENLAILLNKWQIPIISGAIVLGIYAEHWCYMVTGLKNTIESYKWIYCAREILQEIKHQSVFGEDRGFGNDVATLETIDKLIKEQCKREKLYFEPNPGSKQL